MNAFFSATKFDSPKSCLAKEYNFTVDYHPRKMAAAALNAFLTMLPNNSALYPSGNLDFTSDHITNDFEDGDSDIPSSMQVDCALTTCLRFKARWQPAESTYLR